MTEEEFIKHLAQYRGEFEVSECGRIRTKTTPPKCPIQMVANLSGTFGDGHVRAAKSLGMSFITRASIVCASDAANLDLPEIFRLRTVILEALGLCDVLPDVGIRQ